MAIDWLNPSAEVIEAKHTGYNKGRGQSEEEITELREKLETAEKLLSGAGWTCKKCGHAWGSGKRTVDECDVCRNLARAEEAGRAWPVPICPARLPQHPHPWVLGISPCNS